MEKCKYITPNKNSNFLIMRPAYMQMGLQICMGSLIRLYTVQKQKYFSIVTSVDPVNAQADMSVPCSCKL